MALAGCCSFVGFDCFYNVLNCKSLWIKASAKYNNNKVLLLNTIIPVLFSVYELHHVHFNK